MRKTILIIATTITIVLGMSHSAFAQGGLFGYGEVSEEEEYGTSWYILNQDPVVDDEGLFAQLRNSLLPGLPGHGQDTNQNAPLGGDTLLLIGFGAAYALKKKERVR